MKIKVACVLAALSVLPVFHAVKAEPRPIFMNPESTVETAADRKRCARRVLLTLGDQGYALVRTRGVTYTKMDGTKISSGDPQSPATNCRVVDVGAVSGFTTGFKEAMDYDMEAYLNGTPGAPPPPPTTYESNKKLIEDSIRDLKFVRKADGIRQMNFGRTVIYLLPRNIAPTFDEQPAAIVCNPDKAQDKAIAAQKERMQSKDTNERLAANAEEKMRDLYICRANYKHPNGLSFGYTYFEKTPGDHLALDLHIRGLFEQLKYDPKNPPVDAKTIPLENEPTSEPPAADEPKEPAPAQQ